MKKLHRQNCWPKNWFKRINAKMVGLVLEDDGRWTDSQMRVFWENGWYAWWFMLIPVSGISGWYITLSDASKAADRSAT